MPKTLIFGPVSGLFCDGFLAVFFDCVIALRAEFVTKPSLIEGFGRLLGPVYGKGRRGERTSACLSPAPVGCFLDKDGFLSIRIRFFLHAQTANPEKYD